MTNKYNLPKYAVVIANGWTAIVSPFARASSSVAPMSAPAYPRQLASLLHRPGFHVIYFWSSVCPCVRACERYSLIPLAQKYRGKVTFDAVASNEYDLTMPRSQLNSLIAEHHLPFPVIFDPDHAIAKYFNARVTLQTFVIDPAGNIVFDGMVDDSRRFLFDPPAQIKGKPPVVPSSYLATALAEALSGKPVTETPLKEAGCSIDW